MMNEFQPPENDEIKSKQKKGWLKVWFAIEVVAMGKDLATESIKKHVNRMIKAKNTLFTDIKYSEPIEAQALSEQLKQKMQEQSNKLGRDIKGFSITVDITFMCKDLTTLLELVMLYGPSAIEVLEPSDIKLNIAEIQNIANIFSGILHQFAASGVGGLVISTDKKPKK